MKENRFRQLKAFTFYTKTLVMMSALSDENIVAIFRAVTDYYSGKPRPDTDDIDNAAAALLIDELCERLDDAEDKRQKRVLGAQKTNAKRKQSEKAAHAERTESVQSADATNTKTITNTNTKTKTNTSTSTLTHTHIRSDHLPISPSGEIGSSENISDSAANEPQKVREVVFQMWH